MLETIINIVSFISDFFSAIAAGIAIYLFTYKRKSIISFFNLLLNYSIQISVKEITSKIDKLNYLSADDDIQKKEIVYILNDITGQIRGNPILNKKCNVLKKLSKYAENPRNLNEPRKRSIISELRENLRNIELQNYSEIVGEENE